MDLTASPCYTTDRQIHRQTETHRERETEERQTDRQTDRDRREMETDRNTDRQTQREIVLMISGKLKPVVDRIPVDCHRQLCRV